MDKGQGIRPRTLLSDMEEISAMAQGLSIRAKTKIRVKTIDKL